MEKPDQTRKLSRRKDASVSFAALMVTFAEMSKDEQTGGVSLEQQAYKISYRQAEWLASRAMRPTAVAANDPDRTVLEGMRQLVEFGGVAPKEELQLRDLLERLKREVDDSHRLPKYEPHKDAAVRTEATMIFVDHVITIATRYSKIQQAVRAA